MPVACCPFETFFNPETRDCDQGQCPDGTYPIAGTSPVMCCKIGTYWNPEKEMCDDPNDPTDPIEECPKGFYQVAGVMPLQCCPDGSRWIPEMRECVCPDETLPVAGQYPACGEPDVCPPGEYPALLEPEIICCLKGTKYDNASGLCLCPDETPVDEMGLCTQCPDGFYAALRFPELICCPENTWYEGQMKECLCPDMTRPDENGACVDPTDKCEKPYKYDFVTGHCVCWNGMEPIRGDPSIPVDEFGCLPTDCLEGENAFYDKEDNLVCCRDGLVYNYQKDTCVCKDGNLPTATGDCATCEKWENAFFIEDQIICCGVNEYYAADHRHCMCTDGSHVADCPFPCQDNEVHEVDHSGNTAGECIPMCEDGHVFNPKTKTCTCPDGRPIVEGYPGGCPPVTVNCEMFFLPWDTLMGTVCCHEEAHYNRELDQCVCNDGSRPDARGYCGKSCPEELVYAPYPPTGDFACLCPDTLKFPNSDGICMENPCEKPLSPFKLQDGSVACCPEQSYFDMEKKSCICLSTKQPPNDDNECPEKCPEDTVPVFDAETGELNCIAVDCAPGYYLAYETICCRNDMKFDKELFMCVCPLGLSDVDGKCSEKCSYGSVWDGEDCVSHCPEGQIYRNEQCFCALDGSLASRDKPCCKFGEMWDAEKGICTCDGDLFCEKPCPEERPNLFLDKFGDKQCCKKGMNFDVVVHLCMCNPRTADLPAFKPLDESCTCPDGQRQMMSADGTFFSCIDSGCINGLVIDEKTGMCTCPEDSWQFWNSIGVPVCCKRDQKWSDELQECICHETNLPANDDGECEDLGDERCPPGWTYIKEQVGFFGEPVRCMPICPEPSIVYVKPVDEVMIGGIAATVECMCKGDHRYNGTTDNMIDYILYGRCEVEECPPGLVRSDDILTFNECRCPYKWQQLIQTASIPPQLMCTCDDEKYAINEETGMCECKRSIAEFGVFGIDGSCDCPRHMRYNAENDACEEISTGTVIDIDENCWYYDFELEACLSKDQFEEQFDTKPTANPFDQNKEECPGFEVGWKGLKSTKINYKSPTAYLVHVNVLNNQANVDVTVEDYIGFLIFSKRYCGVEFIKELDNGNVKIDFFDKTAAYDKSNVYVRLDQAQSQTVVQFTTNHARDEAGNPELHLATSKKDQFLVHIQLENEIDFLFKPEDCLTRFNIGVMKSEMDFTQDYTHCVANTLWWTPAVIED
ncbi:unnamed protein product [Oikopleura dioica]|uniref:Uncharacterized protein n=1 Tax=Oikopleura dioica TaxID=34765 RepID=E4X617_OIKDI|nr:unnamed protein product [Oikopleura dioica]